MNQDYGLVSKHEKKVEYFAYIFYRLCVLYAKYSITMILGYICALYQHMENDVHILPINE